jgi:hypothetical protein
MNENGIRFAISADDRATRVFAGVRKELQSVQGAAGSLKSALTTFAPTVAAAFSLAAITAWVRTTVNGIDALNDLADATGSSVENLSALEDVAARTGTSMETVGGAVIKLNKTLADAKPGSEQAKALEAIGLSAKELRNIDPAEALLRTAQALSSFADDGNKARLVQELFGKSMREVAPLLKDLAESGKLNATVTTEQAKQAELFNQQLFRLQKDAADAARSITSDLLPALNQYFERLSRGLAQKGGTIFGQELVAEIQSVRLALATSKVEDLAIALRADPSNRGLVQALAAARGEYTLLSKAAADANDRLKATLGVGVTTANAGGGRGFVNPDPVRPSLPAALGDNKPKGPVKADTGRRVDPIIDPATTDALRALEGTDVGKIARLNAQLTELFTLQRETRGSSAVAEAIAKTREELDKLDPAAVAAAKSAERLKAILAQTPSAAFSEVLTDIELLNRAYDDGKLSAEVWAEAVRLSTAKIGGGAADALVEVNTFAEQASRNIQDALGESLERVLGGNFESIGRLWASTLQKMAAQALAAQLNEYLFGATFGTKGGSLGGIVGSFLGGTLFGGARAAGGPVSAGSAYLVGERGPEIVVPRSAGTVLPNGVGMGGPAITLAPTIMIDARSDQAQVAQMVAAGMAQAQQSMWRQLRARGVA